MLWELHKISLAAEGELFFLSFFFSAKGEVVKLEPSCCARLKENLLKGSWLILDYSFIIEKTWLPLKGKEANNYTHVAELAIK